MSIEVVVAELNEIVRPDGAELRVRESSPGAVVLDLDLTASTCPECVVPRDLLLDILRSHLPEVERLELHDPREAVDPSA